jgi:hypothetical protein
VRGARLIVWVLVVASTAGLVWLGADLSRGRAAPLPRRLDDPARQRDSDLPRARRDPNPWARWSVTETLSAHHVLIVHVETRYLNEARAIAAQVADPLKDRYAEVLIYFHRPGRPDPLPPRRVQWTRARGYVESVYE